MHQQCQSTGLVHIILCSGSSVGSQSLCVSATPGAHALTSLIQPVLSMLAPPPVSCWMLPDSRPDGIPHGHVLGAA